MVVDDLDCIASQKDAANKEGEKKLVYQLANSLEAVAADEVFTVFTSSKPERIDSHLLRPGKVDREVKIPALDEPAREQVLRFLLRDTPHLPDCLPTAVALSPGYAAADLNALVGKVHPPHQAAFEAVARSRAASAPLRLEPGDFAEAGRQVVPLAKKFGFTSVPETRWEDIGALQALKAELTSAIIRPLRDPERCRLFNIKLQAGVLLYGPPGCGKTMLAKAVANAASCNFISVKGPELLNKYVGESEKAVRSLFQRCAPLTQGQRKLPLPHFLRRVRRALSQARQRWQPSH